MLIVALVATLTTAASPPAGAPAWHPYNSPLRFSAHFPSQPRVERSERPIKTRYGSGNARVEYVTGTDGVAVFAVESSEMPAGAVPSGKERDFLVGVQQGLVGSGTLLSEGEVRLVGSPGRHFTFRAVRQARSFLWLVRIYYVHGRIHSLFVLTPDTADRTKESQRFFSTFRLHQ